MRKEISDFIDKVKENVNVLQSSNISLLTDAADEIHTEYLETSDDKKRIELRKLYKAIAAEVNGRGRGKLLKKSI